jgi:hypothetical protein
MSVLIEAHRLLLDDLYTHLEEAEYLGDYSHWSVELQDSVRAVLPNLVTVIRGIVVMHDGGPTGTCPTCQAAWPCKSFEMVHRLIKDPDGEFVKLRDARRQQSAC